MWWGYQTLKINIKKNTARYFIDYKIKRKIKKVDTKNDIHADNFDPSKPDFNNIKISSPIQNILTNNKNKHENNSTIKAVVINMNNRY